MEGNQFFTINPGTFTDPNSWSYADLRTLAKDLGLGGNGKRSQLESRLTNWHRARTDASHNLVPLLDAANEEDLPMNVEGNPINPTLFVKLKTNHNCHCPCLVILYLSSSSIPSSILSPDMVLFSVTSITS